MDESALAISELEDDLEGDYVEVLEEEYEELLRDENVEDIPLPPEPVIILEPEAEPQPDVRTRLGPRKNQGSIKDRLGYVPSLHHAEAQENVTEMQKLEAREVWRQNAKAIRKERAASLIANLGDRLQRRPSAQVSKYAHLAPFMTDSEQSDCEDDEDEAYSAWQKKRPKYARVDKNWDTLDHGETTAREYSERKTPYFTPVEMPIVTKLQAERKLLPGGPYFVDKIPNQDCFQYRAGTLVRDTDRHVEWFVEQVERWHMCSFDTEGNAELPYIPSDGSVGRVFVSYSSPDGSVLVFHDCRDTPASIRRILREYRYAKLQSGVHIDVKLLEKEGIEVRGLVDTGTLMALVNPMEEKFGAQKQVETIWGKNVHQKWEIEFMAEYRMQKLNRKNQRHTMQDVLTPFAVLVKAAVIEAGVRMLDSTANIFPLMNEALELCYSKCPADIRHKTDGLIKPQAFRNWHPQFADTKFGLNSRLRTQTIRRARGSFVETIQGLETTSKATRVACAQLIWMDLDLPSSNDMRQANLFIRMQLRCQNCGLKDHSYNECSGQKNECLYPHGPGNVNHPPHSTLMCPVLHSACMECRIRGHSEADHAAGLEQSPMQLRQTFLRFAHRGLLTCLPYLSRVRELKPYHWSAGLGIARLGRNATDLWVYGNLADRIPDERLEEVQHYLEQAERNLKSTLSTYESFRKEAPK